MSSELVAQRVAEKASDQVKRLMEMVSAGHEGPSCGKNFTVPTEDGLTVEVWVTIKVTPTDPERIES